MEQIKPQDAQFLYTETDDNYNHITLLLNFDGPAEGDADYGQLIQFFKNKLKHHPIYSQRLVRLPAELDYPYWVNDEEFEADAHFTVTPLLVPGDWKALREEVCYLHSQPMDMHRPLWDVTIFTGVNCNGDNKNGFTVVVRLHHVAIDGVGLVKMLASFATPLSDADQSPNAEHAEERSDFSWSSVAGRAVKNRLRLSVNLGRTLLNSASYVGPSARRYLNTKPSERMRVYPSRFNDSVAGDKIFDVIGVELKTLSALRSLYQGATMNDVILTISAGALRRYLAKHKELTTHSLVAWIPVNARGATGGSDSGNNLSAFTAPIYTTIADPVARMAKIVSATQAGKSGISAAGLMLNVTKCLPATEQYLFARAINATSAASSTCNLFVSNVPGPAQPIYLAGHRLESLSGLPPLGEGMGLFIATPSYNGKLYFNVISTASILPDIDFFMECIQESFSEMQSML
ncbi:wax ester/triacylglycerol synthase family O-acyltransferase [Zhongshania sp. BJYM1]|uniref:wax ester/triacylglycerol synthase family O-acyltransferase n=1 Tax=Zhongshania aquatica TaxID=2965069 RepID=UPI0022B3E5C7|nr:wax ester/triacylglycerol synthase family O-acyltransferase [Marortus sp. BJYM1]